MSTITLTAATNTTTVPYYQTRTYKDLFENICRSAGIDPSRPGPHDSLTIRSFINTALREAWEYYPWPDLMAVTSTLVSNIDNYAEYDLFSISKYDPRDKRYYDPYTFSVDSDGINILPDLAATATVYLRYRLLFYPFSGSAYSASSTYAVNDMAYDATTGDYYRSLANSNIGNSLTDTAWWDRRRIPAFLFEFTKTMVLADLREAEGQDAKAPVLRAQAGRLMTLEIDKWERQKNQQLRPVVRYRTGG